MKSGSPQTQFNSFSGGIHLFIWINIILENSAMPTRNYLRDYLFVALTIYNQITLKHVPFNRSNRMVNSGGDDGMGMICAYHASCMHAIVANNIINNMYSALFFLEILIKYTWCARENALPLWYRADFILDLHREYFLFVIRENHCVDKHRHSFVRISNGFSLPSVHFIKPFDSMRQLK